MLPGAFVVVDGVETTVVLDEDITDGKNVYHEIIFAGVNIADKIFFCILSLLLPVLTG